MLKFGSKRCELPHVAARDGINSSWLLLAISEVIQPFGSHGFYLPFSSCYHKTLLRSAPCVGRRDGICFCPGLAKQTQAMLHLRAQKGTLGQYLPQPNIPNPMGHRVMSWWRPSRSLLAEVGGGCLGVAIQGCDYKTHKKPPNSPFLPPLFPQNVVGPAKNMRWRQERSLPSHCPFKLCQPMVVASRAFEPSPCAAVNRGLKELLYPGEGRLFGVSPCNDYYKPACFEGRLP